MLPYVHGRHVVFLLFYCCRMGGEEPFDPGRMSLTPMPAGGNLRRRIGCPDGRESGLGLPRHSSFPLPSAKAQEGLYFFFRLASARARFSLTRNWTIRVINSYGTRVPSGNLTVPFDVP